MRLKVLFIIALIIFLIGVFRVSKFRPEVKNSLIKTPVSYYVTLNTVPVILTENGVPMKHTSTGAVVPFSDPVEKIEVIAKDSIEPIYLRYPPELVLMNRKPISEVLIPSGKRVTLSRTRVRYAFKYWDQIRL